MDKKQLMMAVAIASLVGAGMSTSAMAAKKKGGANPAYAGKCTKDNHNGCKGKGSCSVVGGNGCAGKNDCKNHVEVQEPKEDGTCGEGFKLQPKA